MANIQTARKRNIINSATDAQIRSVVYSRVLYLMAEKSNHISEGRPPIMGDIKMVLSGYDATDGMIFDYLLLSKLDAFTLEELDGYKFDDIVKENGDE